MAGWDSTKLKVRNHALATVREARVEIRDQVRRDTNKDTGRTSRAWYATEITQVGSQLSFRMRHDQDASNPPDVLWLDQGTRGGTLIVPLKGKALKFTTPAGTVFRRSVVRGATPAYNFIGPVFNRANWQRVLRAASVRVR